MPRGPGTDVPMWLSHLDLWPSLVSLSPLTAPHRDPRRESFTRGGDLPQDLKAPTPHAPPGHGLSLPGYSGILIPLACLTETVALVLCWA